MHMMSHASANEELSSHNTRDLESTSTFGITDYPGLIIIFAPNILAKQYIPHYKKNDTTLKIIYLYSFHWLTSSRN